ncbi:MAG: M28 family peptidase [Eubacteriales bacterium]|nr:M28 family peptidase [Eubacteriales bacterium]
MDIRERILSHLDTGFSYRLAKQMEQFRSHPQLGYRTAGSRAEFETGEFLKSEMERIGLSQVEKDAVTVDGWEFKKASLSFQDSSGQTVSVLLGAYQTHMCTDGPREFSLMYLEKGTEKDYQGKDVSGKLVLVDINQRDEWWINYPVYQAYLKGAAALIAVQSGGYGEIDDEALNAQDIAGPEYAPAFSISRKDANTLKALAAISPGGEVSVTLDADSRVMRDCITYNICGRIPGRHPDRMILLSAHYDSYFSGFQDDNTAVSMMLGIARALLESGFRPENTIVFCAMAAEEWGVCNSNFDWSAGAYEQVFTVHPDWPGKVIADLNFELPALAHGTRARIRSCYEYREYLEEFLSELPCLTRAYPEETGITAPIETWSDDFSMAISGIPSMVNDFTGGSFMETHYHSQFDNDGFYDEQVYRLHHELFALLTVALDKTAVVPLNFAPVMKRAADGWDEADGCVRDEALSARIRALQALLRCAESAADAEYAVRSSLNVRYRRFLDEGDQESADQLFEEARPLERLSLEKFRLAQDRLVRIDWYGNVYYPHEILLKRLALIGGSIKSLQAGNLSAALRQLYQLDNNAYAFMFSQEVYQYFTDYVFNQPKERLKWGAGRLLHHHSLYELIKALLQKADEPAPDCTEEISLLSRIYDAQEKALAAAAEDMDSLVREFFL